MLTNASPSINVIIAVILSMAPQLLGKMEIKGPDVQNFRQMYAEAQKHAQQIIATGDASELTGGADMAELQTEAALLKPILDRLDPQMMAMLIPPADAQGMQ